MDQDVETQLITNLVGREVYTKNGIFVGEVEELKLNLDAEKVTGLAIDPLDSDLFEREAAANRGIIVPYRWVQSVGDAIIVSDIVERIQQEKQEEEEEEVTA